MKIIAVAALAMFYPMFAFAQEDAHAGKIRQLIGQLKSEKFRERKAASEELANIDDALPYLQTEPSAKESADFGNWIDKTINAILIKTRGRRLERMIELGKKGSLDRMRDAIILWDGDTASKEFYTEIFAVIDQVRIKAVAEAKWNEKKFIFYNMLETRKTCEEIYRPNAKVTFQSTGPTMYFIRSRGISGSDCDKDAGYDRGVFFSSGPIEMEKSILSGAILFGRHKASFMQVPGSMLFCDGDVEVGKIVGGPIEDSLVVCRGNVTCKYIDRSIVLAGGTITSISDSEKSLTRNDKGVYAAANVKKPLGYIHWFDLDQLGVELKQSETRITISKIKDHGIFAKAGFKVGDQLFTIAGQKVISLEECTNQLRRASIEGKTHVKFLRDGKTLEVIKSLRLD